ncbi:MAG: DUF4190 domain-containing protein [Chloroflexota bacterium]|nr:MAG: hypothetical protein KatS3mg045_0883 [Bellilinea sp.]
MTNPSLPEPEVVYPPLPNDTKQGVAIAALVLGILNLAAWCLPICGFPMSVAGIITGIIGLKSSSRGMAIAGLVLSAIGLILSAVNALVGIYLFSQGMFDGQNFNFENFMP